MLNARSLNAKFNALIKDVNYSTAQSVLQSAKHLTVLLTVKHLSQNVRQYAKSLNVIGNVINQLALNQNAS